MNEKNESCWFKLKMTNGDSEKPENFHDESEY